MLWKRRKCSALDGPRMETGPAAAEYQLPNALMDPLGSWTGVPVNPLELPVQDADDL